eukprot:TRINITY_DN28970_c0_g1_i2.p1 TRINITY_DN28970_c0_g1~~TRINITY_DN28970_c0_g1_i2.p1  ORF type:complete len:277 (-),score=66.75 TRINITY_DN28970_c0_g1_i2:64-894(-)
MRGHMLQQLPDQLHVTGFGTAPQQRAHQDATSFFSRLATSMAEDAAAAPSESSQSDDCSCFRYQKPLFLKILELQQNINFTRKLFKPTKIEQQMLDDARDQIIKNPKFLKVASKDDAPSIDSSTFWYAKFPKDVAKNVKSGAKVKIKRGGEEVEACLNAWPDGPKKRISRSANKKALWELCPPPRENKKVPDEDPLPCGGKTKLRDVKYKWKPGDVMEFLGSCRSALAMKHKDMRKWEEDEEERFKLAVKDMTGKLDEESQKGDEKAGATPEKKKQ